MAARDGLPPAVRRLRQLPLLVVVGHHARVLLVAPVRRAAGAANGEGQGAGSAATAVLAKSSLASRAFFASSYLLHKEGDEKTFVTVQGSGLVSIRHVRPYRSDSPVANVRAAASRWAVG